MSLENIEKFLEALKSDTAMLEEFQSSIGGLQSVVDFASSHGFSITLDDAREFLRTQADVELSDEQLEAIAGGKHHHHSAPSVAVATQSAAVQTVAAATTEVTVSETTEAVIAETTEAAAVESSLVAAVEAVVVPVLVS